MEVQSRHRLRTILCSNGHRRPAFDQADVGRELQLERLTVCQETAVVDCLERVCFGVSLGHQVDVLDGLLLAIRHLFGLCCRVLVALDPEASPSTLLGR